MFNKKELYFYDFYKNIKFPSSVDVNVKDNYLYLKFDNNFYFILRLHTASSKITKTLSLKYDTKLDNIDKLYEKKKV